MIGAIESFIGRTLEKRQQALDSVAPALAGGIPAPSSSADESDTIVELSSSAPRPVPVDDFRNAVRVADDIQQGRDLATHDSDRIRQDRVFAAMAAMSAMSATDAESAPNQPFWPGGLPAPTAQELKVAYQRISQRLLRADQRDISALQQKRLEILDTFRNADFSAVQRTMSGPLPVEEEVNELMGAAA